MPPRAVQFDQKVADKICEMIANGMSMRKVLKTPGIPSMQTINKWRADNECFAKQYACARETRADHYADEIVDIADTEKDPQLARNRMDARKWAASKMNPKVYSERHTIAGTGDKDDAIHIDGAGLLEAFIGRLSGLASRE